MKINKKLLAICIAIPLAVGGLAALLTTDSMRAFASLNRPPLSPPGWLFPVAWTILYVLMGVSSYLVASCEAVRERKKRALWTYALQLAFNFAWPLLFFNLKEYLLAFVWLILLWLLILATAAQFFRIRRLAAYLLIPYVLWVTFAGYLNLGVYLLNP